MAARVQYPRHDDKIERFGQDCRRRLFDGTVVEEPASSRHRAWIGWGGRDANDPLSRVLQFLHHVVERGTEKTAEDTDREGAPTRDPVDQRGIKRTGVGVRDAPCEMDPNLVEERRFGRNEFRPIATDFTSRARHASMLFRTGTRVEKPEVAGFAPSDIIRLRTNRIVP